MGLQGRVDYTELVDNVRNEFGNCMKTDMVNKLCESVRDMVLRAADKGLTKRQKCIKRRAMWLCKNVRLLVRVKKGTCYR